MQKEIISLLDEVAFETKTLKEAKERYSDKLAPDFSIFDYLRTDEMGLSRCIANLLNPLGKHGQKGIFLEAFLEKINWLPNIKLHSVDLEKQANGKRRIDIYLKFQNGEIIGIENKPWAGDQINQLSDYASFIESDAGDKKWLLIYLSNNEPSDYSGVNKLQKKLMNEENFICISYTTITEWLMDCACKTKALNVRLFIEELAKYIRINVNGELEMSEENEIKNIILSSSKHLESALHVSLAFRSAKKSLLRKLYDDLKEEFETKGFELIWDKSMSEGWKSYTGFGVKFSKENKFYLRYEFNSPGLHGLLWGIARENNLFKKDDAIWSKINEVMSDQFGSGGKTEWWPWWGWINTDKEFNSQFLNWDSNVTPWISIKEKTFAGKIVNSASLVHTAFNKNPELLYGEDLTI